MIGAVALFTPIRAPCAPVGEVRVVVMTAAVCEVTGSAVGLDVFLDEFDGFVDRLIDQLAPVRFSVPAGAAGSDGPAPPACISVPAATDVDADIDRDATESHHGEGRTLFQLLDAPAGVVDEPRLLAVLKTGVTAVNLLHHLLAAAAVAAERAGIPARRHLRSGADLLTGQGMAPAAAYRLARVGRAAPELPALTRASRLGGVGVEFADAVGKGITHIRSRIKLTDADTAEVVTKLMVQSTPAQVNRRARGIAIARVRAQQANSGATDTDTDVGVPVAENADLNTMTLTHNDEGRVTATLDLDVVTGEELLAALDPLCRPVAEPDGSRDPRPPGRRRADGFGQLLRDYLSGSTRPLSGGVLPHVSLIRPLPDATPFAGGGAELGGHRPANPYVGPYPTGGWSDEFVDMLGFTGPISPATADLITCDCTLDVIHVDGNGAPLDVGRSQRLFPPHIRRALIARDRGCAFPGCGRHPSWCDGHHIRPWDPDGVTSLDNGVLLCRRHHTMIHHYRWQVYLGDDRHPWFIPPPDPTHPHRPREHLRSHTRRTLTVLPGAA